MNRIKSLRSEADMKQSDLAAQLNVGQNTISNWETGKTEPDTESLQRMAVIFSVSIDYILGNSTIRSNSPDAAQKVPVLGVIPAGIPIEAVEEILGWEEIPASWTTGGREYFALKVKGDSMYPEYLDGDTVLLRKQSTCDCGDDCAVLVNGYDSTLKRVIIHDDGALELRPLNPSYPPKTYTADEIKTVPVTIAGVVVELRRKKK